jgi:hypothetical protein
MTFISRNRIFRIGSHTSQAERWISEGAALSTVVYRCTSLGTRASGPPVRRMVGTDWEAISAVMVREPLAGKVCVALPRWEGCATFSVPVLRRTAGTPSSSPWPPSAPTRGAEGGTWGAGANAWWPAHAMVRICTVRASCNIRVFDQVLILVKQNGGSARGQHSLLWFTDAPAWVRGPLARRCGEWLEPIGKRSAP